MALSAVTPALAAETLQRLIEGYSDKSGSQYGPATTNLAGCQLAQKAPNRADNGYIQIAPVVRKAERTRALKGEAHKDKPPPQNAHRLVVVAHKRYGAPQTLLNRLATH